MRSGKHEITRRPLSGQRAGRATLATAAVAIALLSCTTQPGPGATAGSGANAPVAASGAAVLSGLDVLMRDDAAALAGRRVGLITNHTGVDREGTSVIDLLHGHPAVTLVALFSPEHALTGRAAAGEHVASGHDPRTGLPVYSLYGETRKPTAEMLRGIDVLVFDIQDIGTRYYTYVWTMAHSMEAAAEHDIDFVVLDRPNPIGGVLVQGNVLEPAYRTFVGLYPVPTRHGLTPGELARLVNREHGIGARLEVVQLEGWRRSLWFGETGLPWVAPSPNMPDVESAAHYPGTCLFEGTNLSVGRGTAIAFQQIGAPWLDAAGVAERLRRRGLEGVRIEATTFTPEAPGDGRYGGTQVNGLRFIVTDRERYDPVQAGIAALIEIQALHADSLAFRVSHFDRLAGTDRVRTLVLQGADVDRIMAEWPAQLAAFERVRERYLLYP
jgi:uncharacterized protein YbbC (DUF1343 family)